MKEKDGEEKTGGSVSCYLCSKKSNKNTTLLIQEVSEIKKHSSSSPLFYSFRSKLKQNSKTLNYNNKTNKRELGTSVRLY